MGDVQFIGYRLTDKEINVKIQITKWKSGFSLCAFFLLCLVFKKFLDELPNPFLKVSSVLVRVSLRNKLLSFGLCSFSGFGLVFFCFVLFFNLACSKPCCKDSGSIRNSLRRGNDLRSSKKKKKSDVCPSFNLWGISVFPFPSCLWRLNEIVRGRTAILLYQAFFFFFFKLKSLSFFSPSPSVWVYVIVTSLLLLLSLLSLLIITLPGGGRGG